MTASWIIIFLLLVMAGGGGGGVGGAAAAAPAAIYVLGDSLADVGNNNHLVTILKADFAYNGIDYPGGAATGRFCNGMNSVDFIAQSLGLPSPPPFLDISSGSASEFLAGVNFASGGAGILDSTNKDLCLSFNKQINYYNGTVYKALVEQLGSSQALAHLQSSIFVLFIGSNDIFAYSNSKKSSASNQLQQYTDTLISALKVQLTQLYNLGARKFLFAGAGPVGCCPSQRTTNATGGCNSATNQLSQTYNQGASSLLQQLQWQLEGMSYSFFNGYDVMMQYIEQPTQHGFADVTKACCGLGILGEHPKLVCLKTPLLTALCHDRTTNLFWDPYHPTEAAAKLLAAVAYSQSQPFVYPINVQTLAGLA